MQKNLLPVLIISKYLSLSFCVLLSILEILQFLGKVLNKECKEYISVQNTCEVFMLCSSLIFFILQHLEHDSSKFQRHLLGWSIFLAWMNLTNFLGRFDVCGIHIYRSWHVMKNVVISV